MATTMAGVSLSVPRIAVAKLGAETKGSGVSCAAARPTSWSNNNNHKKIVFWSRRRGAAAGPVMAAPDKLSEKVAESIKEAEEACTENPASGECVAAWDEVEELSAAASHARDRKKATDPLEEYCKDNPETEECRTYED